MLNYTLSYSLSPKTGKCLFSNRNLNAATFFTLLHWSSSNVIISYCSCRNEFYKGARTRNLLTPQKRWVSLGSWLTRPAGDSQWLQPLLPSLYSSYLVETSEPSAEHWFLWCVRPGRSWALEQAKVVSKAGPCPSPGFALRSISAGFPIKPTTKTL